MPEILPDCEELKRDSKWFRVFSSDGEIAFEPKPWIPEWFLEGEHLSTFLKDASGLEDRHPKEEPDGEPVLSVLGFPNYRSRTQKAALRTILCAKPGSTVAVNMPTGEGKSALFFIPSLLINDQIDELGVTPIVVPTVALAEDLARRLEEKIQHPVCYSGDAKDGIKDEIVAACEKGTQGPVICNPEALVQGRLANAIKKAAREGFISHFVIDEAHMVANWGDQFRPTFQSLEGLRKTLLESSPPESKFITILTSATLTGYHMDLLEETFSEPDSFQIVHGARLRSEPSYWQVNLDSHASSREEIILDCAQRLPRPWILYGTKTKTVDDLYEHLLDSGFNRVGRIKGGDSERKEQLGLWNADKLDIMVATSAFGLGVDKTNVRAVVHAELPESVDRFYQDVGRGGRDGKTCLSLLLWKSDELTNVERMGRPRQIGTEFGHERWMSMFNSAQKDGGQVCVNLETPRTAGMYDNDESRRWNVRVLNLMKRSGLLTFQNEWGARAETRLVCVNPESGHSNKTHWDAAVSSKRGSIKKHYQQAKDLMKQMLEPGDECIAQILKRCYDVENRGLSVAKPCGGCRHCREAGKSNAVMSMGSFPTLVPCPPLRKTGEVGEGFIELTRQSNRLLVTFGPGALHQEALKKSLIWLLYQGFHNFIGFGEHKRHLPAPDKWYGTFLFAEDEYPYPDAPNTLLPTVAWIENQQSNLFQNGWEKLEKPGNEPFVLFCNENGEVPDWSPRKIVDLCNCKKVELEKHDWN
ncbi:MAG: ATP-dependent DNA helicase RecQ [Opitutae bacterium]|nr:ATP-dependent DNA helicase RecQ [Opitutae bacterium]